MLATHTIDPEDLYTITAGGFSATADAFARDEETDGLWFVSMVGAQTALKAIWASLLKQPPDVAHIIRGADGMALSRGLQAVRRSPRDDRNVDDQDRPSAGLRRLARPGLHQDRRVRIRERQLPAAGADGGGGTRPSITASWTSAARCPCTAPGPTGSGGGAWTTGRSSPCNRSASPPTGAPPRPASSGRTSPAPWRQAGSPCPGRKERPAMDRMLKRATRRNKRRGSSATPERLAALLPRRGRPVGTASTMGRKHLTSRSGQPHFYRPATEAERRDPSVDALPPHPRIEYGAGSAQGRLRAGAADGRRQPRRAHHRLLHRLRGEHERDSPSPLLPAQRGRRRGGRGCSHRTQENIAIAA